MSLKVFLVQCAVLHLLVTRMNGWKLLNFPLLEPEHVDLEPARRIR